VRRLKSRSTKNEEELKRAIEMLKYVLPYDVHFSNIDYALSLGEEGKLSEKEAIRMAMDPLYDLYKDVKRTMWASRKIAQILGKRELLNMVRKMYRLINKFDKVKSLVTARKIFNDMVELGNEMEKEVKKLLR